jgi:hypothetical protein
VKLHGKSGRLRGNSQENYQVWKIAQMVSRTFPACEVTLGNNDGDNRSYRVSFDKMIKSVLAFPDFNADEPQRWGKSALGVIRSHSPYPRDLRIPGIYQAKAPPASDPDAPN